MDSEEVLVDPGTLALAQAMMPKADHASHVIFARSALMDLFDAITIGDTTYYRDGHTEPYPDPKVYRTHGTRRNSAPIHSDVTGFYQRRKR